jgi:hypothetical protein
MVSAAAAVLLPAPLGGSGCGDKPADTATAGRIPEVIPYLDARPSAVDGQGSAAPKLFGPFPVGSRSDFQIKFTVGNAGIKPGGYILLQISP